MVVPEDSPLPDVVPNTYEDEPSVVDSNTVMPTRRAPAPRESEPQAAPEPAAAPPPRRKLTRRATSRASSRAPSSPPAPPSQPAIQEEPAPVQEEPAPEVEPVPQRKVGLSRCVVRKHQTDRTSQTLVRRARAKAALADEDSMDLGNNAGRASEEQTEVVPKRSGSAVVSLPFLLSCCVAFMWLSIPCTSYDVR